MDRVTEAYSEQFVASVMETVGFSTVNKSTLQRFTNLAILYMKKLLEEVATVQKNKDAEMVTLADFFNVLEQRGENIDHLLHFLKTHSKSRQCVSVAYPAAKEYTNPLKIPDLYSADLKTQPIHIDDHLPCVRDALEFYSLQKRMEADIMNISDQMQNSNFGRNGMANGERGDEQSARMKYPSEAGRSRHRMQAVGMSDSGDIYSQRSGKKRSANASPPPVAYVNSIWSAIQPKSNPFMMDISSSYPKPSVPGGRGHGHPKNGVVNLRPDHRHDRFTVNPASPLAAVSGGGDNRDLNGAYSPPRDDLPEVDEEEDIHPSKVWPPKEDPLASNHAIESSSFKRKLNDTKSRNFACEWPNSPKLGTTNTAGAMASSSLTNTPLSVHSTSQSKHRESLSSRFNKASAKDLTALFSHKSDPLDSPPPPPVSSKSSKSTKKATSSRSKSKVSSRSKSKPSSTPLTFNSPKHSSSSSSSKAQDKKRTFEDTLETSTTTEEMVETPEKIDSPLHLQSTVDRFKASISSRHKSSKTKVTVEDTTHVQTGSKSKRRKVDSSATPESTPRSKSRHSPEPLSESIYSPKPMSDLFTDVSREKRNQGQSSDNTPSRTSVLLQSSDEDETSSTRKTRKVSRSPPPSNKRRLSEWEDVPLSKRVPASSIPKLESRPLEQSMNSPAVEDTGDSNQMVKLGPNLTMKINLSKIKQDSASGTGSPASTTAPPPATLESNPVSVFEEKFEEEEYAWVRDHAARRRHRSRSLSDGEDDAAVMRFVGLSRPSPPSPPDPDSAIEPIINSVGADLEGEERRTSTDSLPPPSLMPTVPLPKIKIQKVKGTTSSFVTAPADSEAVSAPPASNTEHHRRPARPHHRSKRRTTDRSRSSRSPSPPTLAPALTPPPASANDDQAPTLTLVAAADAVESVVLEQSEDESFVEKKYHSQALSPPTAFISSSTAAVEPAEASPPAKVKSSMSSSKKSGGSSSKKKFSKRSASKSRSRPKMRPQLYKRSQAPTPSPTSDPRSITPETPPAVLLELGCEDLGYGFRKSAPPASPSPPPPPPPPPAPTTSSRSKSKAPRSSTAGLGSGSSMSSKKGIGASNATSVVSGTSSNKSKKAATSSSKSKSHGGSIKSAPSNSAGGASSSSSVKVNSSADAPAEITKMEVQVDVMLHGSSYYFDSNGVQIWICPLCHMEDNGSLMIGCDQCDDWYHGRCLNIYTEPEQDIWYCPRCVKKQATAKEASKPKKKGSKAGRRRA